MILVLDEYRLKNQNSALSGIDREGLLLIPGKAHKPTHIPKRDLFTLNHTINVVAFEQLHGLLRHHCWRVRHLVRNPPLYRSDKC